jgi:hypothetical protein
MGVLTDLFIANAKEATEIARDYASHKHRAIDLEGFDQIKGATLWAILRGDDVENADYIASLAGKFECLHEAGENGPWIYHFPTELTSSLAELNDEEFESVVARWAATEEFEGCEHEDVLNVLEVLGETAASADADGKSILMWVADDVS